MNKGDLRAEQERSEADAKVFDVPLPPLGDTITIAGERYIKASALKPMTDELERLSKNPVHVWVDSGRLAVGLQTVKIQSLMGELR